MSTTNSHDYTFQQVGLGSCAEINTGLHNHILCKAAYTRGAEKYQPGQSRRTPARGITRTIQGIFSSLLS